ncbi:hypothetical protein [Geodermatophilus dictyosporus]|uniref:hypothetical protein n=1 Tax=Geodermatophilus dictyosporus TaxID=1523247 RepID=UPI0010AA4052|nr:hypothetical protein [Geodermatophilus dictyosporus]
MRGSLLALGLAVVVAGAVLVGSAAGGASAPVAGATPSDPLPGASSAPSAAAPAPVADWLAAALPVGTDVAASAAVRDELAAAGVPADRLRPAEDGVPPGALLAVVGPAPGGSRVVAGFDRSGNGSTLLVVDPAPGGPTAEEFAQRQALAAALLANPTTGADGATADVLARAEVDQRLLGLLAALAAQDGVGIGGLPRLPGEEGSGTPARRAVLTRLGDAAVPADPAATRRLVSWLEAQLPPFAPDDVTVTPGGVLVSFCYVSDPDAVVTAATR